VVANPAKHDVAELKDAVRAAMAKYAVARLFNDAERAAGGVPGGQAAA